MRFYVCKIKLDITKTTIEWHESWWQLSTSRVQCLDMLDGPYDWWSCDESSMENISPINVRQHEMLINVMLNSKFRRQYAVEGLYTFCFNNDWSHQHLLFIWWMRIRKRCFVPLGWVLRNSRAIQCMYPYCNLELLWIVINDKLNCLEFCGFKRALSPIQLNWKII